MDSEMMIKEKVFAKTKFPILIGIVERKCHWEDKYYPYRRHDIINAHTLPTLLLIYNGEVLYKA